MLRLPISAMGCSQTRRQWKMSCLVPLGTEKSFFRSCMLEFRIWALLRNPTVEIQHGHCASSISFMSAQVKLPVKKKIHWKGFIKLLSLHLRIYFCLIILARTQHSGMHFGWPARMTARTSWVSDAYPLVLMCLWWMRVVTRCSQWPREWHLVQGSEVMRELNLKMSLLTTGINLPTIRMPPPVPLPPPVLLPHLCHPPFPRAHTRRGGTLML